MTVNQLVMGSTTGNSRSVDALNLPKHIDVVVLVAGVAQDYTLPAGAELLFFNPRDTFFMKTGSGTASIPTVSTTDGSASEMNPSARTIRAETVISLISSVNTVVHISVYS